jgi:predicted Zn finger-like uncharacterized protein
MKVQCGQCPAKYAVSDERVQDKKVRIHCKRCGASIVVDGKVDPPLVTSTPARKSVRPPSSPPESPPPPPPEREPESQRSPRAVAHTIMGGLEAPVAERLRSRSQPPPRPMRSPASPYVRAEEEPRTGMPANHRGLTDPPPGAQENRWRVALTKQDLRWMTTDEIVQAYHAGAVKLETFVFRTGMPTWVTLLEVPEIAEALSEAGSDSTGASTSSLPPPRSPASQPPPRRLPPRTDATAQSAFAELDELDASEPLPFALVAERSNGASPPPGGVAEANALGPAPPRAAEAHDAEHSPEPPPVAATTPPGTSPHLPAGMPAGVSAAISPGVSAGASPGVSAGVSPGVSAAMTDREPHLEAEAPVAFAAARDAAGSSRWVWVAVVLLLLGAVAALIGPRYGLRLL